MRGISVRAARADDLATVVELRMLLLREYGDHELYRDLRPDATRRAFDLFRAQLESPYEVIFLAEHGTHPIGILRCVDTPGSPLLMPERYCYVSSVYVRPEERRRGVLRLLLDAAELWCADRGLAEMRLHNSASSALAMRAWDAFGFEVVEQVRRRVLGTPRDERTAVSASSRAY